MSASVPPPRRFGCCSCCLVVLVLLVAAVIGGGVMAYRNTGQIAELVRGQLQRSAKEKFRRLEEAKKIPEDQKALYDDLKARILDPKVNVVGIFVGQGVLVETFEDGKIDAVEQRMLEEARDFLKANPAPSLEKMWEFERKFDKIKRIPQAMAASAVIH